MPKLQPIDLDAFEAPTVPAPEPPTKTPTPKKPTKPRTAKAETPTTPRVAKAETQRASAYLTADQFEEVRRAYVTDLSVRGDDAPNSLGEWVTEAVMRHNALTPQSRRAAIERIEPDDDRRQPRSWPVPTHVLEDAQAAIDADRDADLGYRALTPYITEAVLIATQRTRRANGGTLLHAPDGQLPRRRARTR